MKFNFKLPLILSIALFTGILSAAELVEITTGQLQEMQQQNALVIDIRTKQEWAATGTIPDSLKLQFYDENGKSNSERWLMELNKNRQTPNQPIILVCRSGNRSERVGNYLTQSLGMNNIYHLQNGLTAWLKQKGEIEKNCSPEKAC